MKESVCIVAEVGLNHNGDMELAKSSILKASESGADAVKFQYYRVDDFLLDKESQYSYKTEKGEFVESQYNMFKRCELSFENMAKLIRYGTEHGVIVFATPTSVTRLRELASMGVSLLKNGSDYLGNLPLIEEMGRSGIKTILSTGMAQDDEVADAVLAYRSAGGSDLVLLHCTSLYPTPIEQANVSRLSQLKTHGASVGYSDHTESFLAAQLAVALGASIIEKHFTLDNTLNGPDHLFSASPETFSKYVREIRLAEKALRNLVGREKEQENKRMFTLSCAAASPLERGWVIKEEDVLFLRPGTGIRPKDAHLLIGRKLRRSMNRGELFDWRGME